MASIKINDRTKQVIMDTFGVDIDDDQVKVSIETDITETSLILGTLEVPFSLTAEDIINPDTGEALKHYKDYTYTIEFNGESLTMKSTQALNKYNLTTNAIKKIISKLAPGAAGSRAPKYSEAELEEIAAEKEILKSLKKK